jgi:hypothetical protein
MRRIAKLQGRIAAAEERRERAKQNNDFTSATQIHEREVRPAQATYHAALSSAVEPARPERIKEAA